MKNQTTVCLINYARPWNIPVICESLLEYGFDDIIVYDQCAYEEFDLPSTLPDSIRIVSTDSRNIFTLGRYIAAQKSDREFIATLDDDYVVTDQGWDQLLVDDGRIHCQLPTTYGKFSLAYHLPWVCLGYGSVFPKSLVDNFFVDWYEAYGFDEILQKKADRAFTSYVGQWNAKIGVIPQHFYPLSNPSGKSSEVDKSAIHKRKDHWDLTNQAAEKGTLLRHRLLSSTLPTPNMSTYLMPSIN